MLRPKIDELIDFNDPLTFQKLQEYAELAKIEKGKRIPSISKPHVVTYRRESTKNLYAVPPGSVTLFFSNNKKFLNDVIQAFGKDDPSLITKLMNYTYNDFSKREFRKLKTEDFKELINNNFIDLEYNSKVLLEDIIVSKEYDFLIVHFPYNGGNLDNDKFNLIEWHDKGQGIKNSENNSVLVINPPELTEAEIEAVRLLPPEQSSVNIGPGEVVGIFPAALAVALLAAALMNCPGAGGCLTIDETTPEGKVCMPLREMERIKLAEDEIKNLGPYATARQLTSLRGKLIQSLY